MTKTLYYSVEKSEQKNDEDNYCLIIHDNEKCSGTVIAKYNVKLDRLMLRDVCNNLDYLKLIPKFVEEAHRKEAKNNVQ